VTQPPEMTPDRVAELQKQLQDAAAQMAEVQRQLAQAQGTPGAPPAAMPTAMPTPLPAGTPGVPPVPYSNPQVIFGQPGQQVDLNAVLGPQMAQRVRESISHLALDPRITAALGGEPGLLAPASPESVARLADPPRRVPFGFRIVAFESWSWWEAFSVMMVVVAPIAVWGFFPQTVPAALILGALAIVVVRGRKYLKRIALLKWGKVATVTNSDELSRGTYYSGTTYQNMLVRQANGWDVTKRFYSGPASKTKVEYTLDGTNGSITLRGLPYHNGVVLADSRKPTRALCVSSFTFPVKPDVNGEWQRGGVSPWSWLGVVFTLCIHASIVAAAVVAVQGLWLD
jgi:hypothetical protein